MRKNKPKIQLIDEMNLTQAERDTHFFDVGYEYAILHLRLGLKEDNLEGLEKNLMKHLNHLEKQISEDVCECGHKKWEEHKSSFYNYKGLKMVAQECNVKGCKCKKFVSVQEKKK